MNRLLGHIKWLLRSRRTRQLDEIALGIADRYGMRKEYLAARKCGFSPLEALEDWDMVTDEDKRVLVDDKETRVKDSISTLGFPSFIVSVFALIVSICTIVATVRTNDKTNHLTEELNDKTNTLTERLNSKEYQISENLKYDLIELVSVLRAIDNKAKLYRMSSEVIDFSYELESLKNIQIKPGYLVFLNSISERSDRIKVEEGMRLLTDLYLISNSSTMTEVREHVKEILNVIACNANLSNFKMMEFEGWIQDLCYKELENTIDEEEYYSEQSTRYKDFLKYLEDKYPDSKIVRIDYILFPAFARMDSIRKAKLAEATIEIENDSINNSTSIIAMPNIPKGKGMNYMEKMFLDFLINHYREDYYEFCQRR